MRQLRLFILAGVCNPDFWHRRRSEPDVCGHRVHGADMNRRFENYVLIDFAGAMVLAALIAFIWTVAI